MAIGILNHDIFTNEEYVDDIVNKSNVKNAIEDWMANNADENDNCIICFFGHGNRNIIGVYQNNSEGYIIESFEFAKWIENINCNILTIIFDICHGGSFIDELIGKNRIIITSTSANSLGMATLDFGAFSYHFYDYLSKNNSFGQAWEYKDEMLIDLEKTPNTFPWWQILNRYGFYFGLKIQNPKIDENGDGVGSGSLRADKLPLNGDGNLALNTYP